jgi:hypothetical protein
MIVNSTNVELLKSSLSIVYFSIAVPPFQAWNSIFNGIKDNRRRPSRVWGILVVEVCVFYPVMSPRGH